MPAANFGARKCRGEMLAMMIDGARMASPGLVRALLDAGRLGADTVVAVPGYHLGDRLQQEALRHGYDEAREARLLASIGWPADGYRLFNIACLSGSCRDGPLLPFAESNCLAMHRPLWRALGGIDPRFTETGGGQANLDLYKRACEWPGTELVIAHGEGTFHQFHGGVTTGTRGAERERHMRNHSEQYRRLRGEHFSKPARRGRLFGRLHPSAARFLELSIEVAQRQGAAP